MSRVLSFDISLTATGFAVAEGGRVTEHGLITGKFNGVLGILRMIQVRDRVCDKVDKIKPDLVVFEDLSFGSKGAAVHEHAGVAYMIRAEMVSDQTPYILVAPSQLKKFATGSGAAPKELVIKEVLKRFSVDCMDNNIADAVTLSFLGAALLGDWEPQTNPQRDVLAKVSSTSGVAIHAFRKREPSQQDAW